MSKRIRIGTRGSELALWQANFAKNSLEKLGLEVTLVTLKTKGDLIQHLSFDKIEGKGFFTSELEQALLENRIDLAVHSMKDLPTESSKGVMIAGVSQREDPADWLIIDKAKVDGDQVITLAKEAVVGTSSNRRKAQLCFIRPDVILKDIRGNVPTRVRKIETGEVDAVILAAAGLKRIELDLGHYEVVKLHPREFVPAPAQGVMAFQCRTDDDKTVEMIRRNLHHPAIARVTNIERKILRLLQGGCHLPLGVYCEQDKMGYYHVWSAYAASLSEPLRHFNLSYTTADGLAEAVVENYLQ
ncbi:MAG: hydroxymethylbilane synthase [Saprospiraceae bacterium]|nr:hydroxymethylbilane synthase [Saprospiraceae bacterium]